MKPYLFEDAAGTAFVKRIPRSEIIEQIDIFRGPISDNDELVVVFKPIHESDYVAVFFEVLE